MTYSNNDYTNNEVPVSFNDEISLPGVESTVGASTRIDGLPSRPDNDDRPGLPDGGITIPPLIEKKIKEWIETNYPDFDPDEGIEGTPIKDLIKEKLKEYLENNLTDDQKDKIDALIEAVLNKVEEIKEEIKQEIVDRINDWFDNYPEEDKGKIFKIIECHGGIPQLEDNVDVYDPANTRALNVPQFPDCDTDVTDPNNLSFMYAGGWNYEDATRGLETGYTTGQVRVIRSGKIGMPRDYDNEKNNPYRYPHLPPRATKMIAKEPKKFMWVHPFLERAVEDMDGEPTRPMAFSRFRTNDNWQSGAMNNGPSDTDVYNGSGFHTSPGGKFSVIGQKQPARLKYTTEGNNGKWIAIWGNSRGVEMMGYPDEPTEGHEYGCIGMSGWFTSAYNTSAGTQTNGGIKFAYTMYRIDTGIMEIIANVLLIAELLESLEQEGEDSFSVPTETAQGQDPKVKTSQLAEINAENYVDKWSAKDFSIIEKLMDRFDIKSNYYKNRENKNTLDIRKVYKKGGFDRLKRTTLRDTEETHLALGVVFDLANHYMNIDQGRKSENDHIDLIEPGTITRRIKEGETITLFDFFNHLATKVTLGDEDTYRVIDEDINFEEYARHLLGNAPDNDQPDMLEFILDMKEKDNFDKLRYVNGELAAILTTGFEITFTNWKGKFLGWCDACMSFGGDIKALNSFRYECVTQEEDTYGELTFPQFDVYECDSGEGFDDVHRMYEQPSTFSEKPDNMPGGTLPLPEERPEPEKGQMSDFQLQPEPAPTTKAQLWRGFYAIPAPSAGAEPSWPKWDTTVDQATGQPNMTYTYGPFKKKEMEYFYKFITPKGGQNNVPRNDFGLTWWMANKPSGPWTQGPTQPPGDSPACRDEGYTVKRPGSFVLRGKDPDTGESLAGKPAKYFRVTFWQWMTPATPGKAGKRGPKVEEWMYPPGYTIGGKAYAGMSPRGLWFDSIVTPSKEKDVFEEYYDDSTTGPVYHTLELEDTLELHDYQHEYWTMNYMNQGQAGFYKLWGKFRSEQNSDTLKVRPEPEVMGVYTAQTPQAIDIKEQPLGTKWKDHWKLVTTIQNPGEANHVIVHLNTGQEVLFTARDSSRKAEKDLNAPGDKLDRDWQPAGEPWVSANKIGENTVKKHRYGPAYWGELHSSRERPNFYDDRWQVPLHTYHPDAYEHTPGNTTVFKGKRIQLKTNKDPSQGGKYRTQYTYDVYFVQDDKFLNKVVNEDEVLQWAGTGKTHFIYAGTLNYNDDTPFTITCPSDKMIFAARDTSGRVKDSWWNDGERIQLICKETTNARDARKGPGYWAFGDYGSTNTIRKGFRGYVDFTNPYWSNPLTDASDIGGISVTRGKVYTLTPGVDMGYTYRIIWGNSDKSKSPILYEDPNFGRTSIATDVNTEWYQYEEDDQLLRPPFSNNTGVITVEAKGDQLYFGAFRYDNTDDGPAGIDRPTLYEWSRFGEPVDVEIEEEITVEGCSFWGAKDAHTNNTVANLSRYKRPLIDLVTENKNIATERGEDMADLSDNIMILEDGDKYIRTFEIHQGRNYLFKRTADTPSIDFTVRLLKDKEQLSSADPIDVTPSEIKNRVWKASANPLDHRWIDNIASDTIIFNAFDSGREESDWSKRGEPVYLEVYEQVEEGVLNAYQYWTDWDKPDNQVPIAYKAETANTQLKNTHWTNPLNELDINALEDVFIPGKQYKVWVDDDPLALGDRPCPNYMHVFFAEGHPQAINTGMTKDYVVLGVAGNQNIDPEDRYGPTINFNGEQNACTFIVPEGKGVVVMGAWQTGNRRTEGLKGWQKGGEPIKVRYQEIPIEPLRGPVLWGDHVDQRKTQQIAGTKDITEYFALPDGGRGVDPALPPTNGDTSSNPYHYDALHSMGDNGTEIKPRVGSRYRFTPNTDVESWLPNTIDIPYDMRWWFMKDASSLDPKRVKQNDYKAGRAIIHPFNHVDVIIDDRYMQFGAFDTVSVVPAAWSEEGEPLNHLMEYMPELPLHGPAYFAKKEGEFPAVNDPHFYKPLVYERVVSGSTLGIVPGTSFASSGGGKLTVWFITDDYRDSWKFFNQIKKAAGKGEYPPIPIDPLHPEDMQFLDEIRDEFYIPPQAISEFYVKGPTIDMSKPGDEAPVIKVPQGCSRMFFGWYNQTGRTLNNWNRDGEKIPFTVEEKVYGEKEGPVYWGDTPSKKAEFNNPHFEEELRFTRVVPNKFYDIEQYNATAMENYGEVDVYEFNPTERNVLNPALNNLSSFKKVGTVIKNGGSTLIEVSEAGLIFSARNILPTYNKKKATDWSPLGEPSPFKINEATIKKGPVYFAESSKSWNAAGGQPDLSNLKWKQDPVESYKVPSSECEIYITQDVVDADYSVWYCESATDLKPGPSNAKVRWKEVGTFKKGTKKTDEDESSMVVPMDAKYIVIGYHNQKAGENRTWDNWSDWGEPGFFKFRTRRWGNGPGYPAYQFTGGNAKFDHNELRWAKPMKSNVVPKRNRGTDKFITTSKYTWTKLKTSAGVTQYYQLMWTKVKNPTSQSQIKYGRKINTNSKPDNEFTQFPPAGYDYLYYTIYKTGNKPYSSKEMLEFSPTGTNVPWKVKREKKEWHLPWWLELLLGALAAILAALIAVLAYFAAMAPLDVIMEMVEEGPNNKYPIKRKKIIYSENDAGDEAPGYNYPDVEWLSDDSAFYTGMDNEPQWFNYTGDIGVRIWAIIMKLRHNGFMFHCTNAKKTSLGGGSKNTNFLEFSNLTPTYGFNYSRLSSRRLKRCFRHYDKDAKTPPEDIQIYNPYDGGGTRVIRPDTRPDPIKQAPGWDDRNVWFKPAYSYCPQLKSSGNWYPSGVAGEGAKYKLDANYTDGGDRKAFPCVTSPVHQLDNIFSPIGAGLTVSKYYSSDSGTHAHAMKILNGDLNMEWPGLESGRGDFIPGLDFDLKFGDFGGDANAAANWQILRMDLNFVIYDPLADVSDGLVPYAKLSRSLTPYLTQEEEDDGNYLYQFRKTFDQDPQYSNYKQLSRDRPLINIKAKADVPVDDIARLESISIVMWIAGDNKNVERNFIISNLRYITEYE